MFRKHLSTKAILRRKIKMTIELAPNHWFSSSVLDKPKIPDVTYAFYQTLKSRFGFFPKNKADVKFIRQIFHDIYINEYKGVYRLDLEKTYSSPLDTMIPVKFLEHYKNHVTHTKNVSPKRRLKLIRDKKRKLKKS